MSKSIDQYLEDATRYYVKGHYEEGLKACESVFKLDPLCSRAYHGRGLILVKQRKYKAAFESYEKAYEMSKENAKLLVDMAELLFIFKRFEESGTLYRQAIQLNNKYRRDYLYKTQELIDTGFRRDSPKVNEYRVRAISTFRNAMLFNPTDDRISYYISTLEITESSNEVFRCFNNEEISKKDFVDEPEKQYVDDFEKDYADDPAYTHPSECNCYECVAPWEPWGI